ncbi:MAG TPA: PQQ-dependent sugar dehydrogenase [Bacteroidales bacterium]|nr:PQQ-dependent sugar dehydrogenase [Bacteroidales bacterium]
MKHIYTLLILFTCLNFRAFSQIMVGKTQVDTTSIATGLDTPWEILWGPDDHIWITERKGTVSRLNPQTRQVERLITIAEVYEEGESGLLGMTLHPDFTQNSYVYLVYNYLQNGSIKERLVRYTYNGRTLENPSILLDNIGGGRNHDGSRLLIDGDKLFMTTGDAYVTSTAQDKASLSGKILRMNLDGTIPDDNPIPGSYIWTWGHRNPQGLVIGPSGKIYSSEHGPSNDDELNLIVKNRNYGWPNVEGACDSPTENTFCQSNNVAEPLKAWTPTLAVAGIDYYNSDSIPLWKNSILMTSLKAGQLVSMKLSSDGQSVTDAKEWFNGWFGRMRDICIAPNGRVFISTSNLDGRGNPKSGDDRIVQIKAVRGGGTAINDLNSTNRLFTVYPNPMQGNATIKLKESMENASFSLYSMSGQLIFSDQIKTDQYELNRELPAGVYLLKITGKSGSDNQSLVVY